MLHVCKKCTNRFPTVMGSFRSCYHLHSVWHPDKACMVSMYAGMMLMLLSGTQHSNFGRCSGNGEPILICITAYFCTPGLIFSLGT